MRGGHMQGLADKIRTVIYVPETADGHISEGIVSRRISDLRNKPPLKPFPEISLVECNPEIVEEICGTASS